MYVDAILMVHGINMYVQITSTLLALGLCIQTRSSKNNKFPTWQFIQPNGQQANVVYFTFNL